MKNKFPYQVRGHRCHGMTLIGMLFTTIMVCMAGLLVIKVVPVYLKYYEVRHALSSLSKIPVNEFTSDVALDAKTLNTKLFNELYVNGIQDITQDQIILQPTPNGVFLISVSYQVITPLMYNISLLFHFSATQEVKTSAE